MTSASYIGEREKSINSVIICCFIVIAQYFEYGFMGFAASEMAKYFFHSKSLLESIGYLFAIYSIGTAFAKTCGSIVFGFIADMFDLNIAIKIPPFIALLASCIFIFCPSYSEVGYYSIVLFVIASILFQLSVSGEIDNTRLYIGKLLKSTMSESFVLSCKYTGLLLATLLSWVISIYDIHFKIGFIVAAICTLIAIFLRGYLYMIPKRNQEIVTVVYIFRSLMNNKLLFIYQVMLYGLIGSTGYFHITFSKIYFVEILSLLPSFFPSFNITILAVSVIFASMMPFRSLYKQAICFMLLHLIILCILALYVDRYTSTYMLMSLMILSSICTAFYHIPLLQLSKLLLPKESESTFLGVSHSIGSIIFSKTTIIVCLFIWKSYKVVSYVYLYPIVLISVAIIIISLQHYYYKHE